MRKVGGGPTIWGLVMIPEMFAEIMRPKDAAISTTTKTVVMLR
jgi:hypothetical protein